MKNFMNNKFSFGFINYNMHKLSSKNYVSLSNAFFLNNLQRTILTNKSFSSSLISKLMIGDETKGDSLETSSTICNQKLSEGNVTSEFLITNNSKFIY